MDILKSERSKINVAEAERLNILTVIPKFKLSPKNAAIFTMQFNCMLYLTPF